MPFHHRFALTFVDTVLRYLGQWVHSSAEHLDSEFEQLQFYMFHSHKSSELPPIFEEIPWEQRNKAVDEVIRSLLDSAPNRPSRIKAHILADKANYTFYLSGDYEAAEALMMEANDIFPMDRTLEHRYGTLYMKFVQKLQSSTDLNDTQRLLDYAFDAAKHFEESRSLPLGARGQPHYPFVTDMQLFVDVLKAVCRGGKFSLLGDEVGRHAYFKHIFTRISFLSLHVTVKDHKNVREGVKAYFSEMKDLPAYIAKLVAFLESPRKIDANYRDVVCRLALVLEATNDGVRKVPPQLVDTVIQSLRKVMDTSIDNVLPYSARRLPELHIFWLWCHSSKLEYEVINSILVKFVKDGEGIDQIVTFYQMAAAVAHHYFSLCKLTKSSNPIRSSGRLDIRFPRFPDKAKPLWVSEILTQPVENARGFMSCLQPIREFVDRGFSVRDVQHKIIDDTLLAQKCALLSGVVGYRDEKKGTIGWGTQAVRFWPNIQREQFSEWKMNTQVNFLLVLVPTGLQALSRKFNCHDVKVLKSTSRSAVVHRKLPQNLGARAEFLLKFDDDTILSWYDDDKRFNVAERVMATLSSVDGKTKVQRCEKILESADEDES
eukprot:c17471_g1_i2.p1 GENE.c17471_g1_i2~~c17471_g1_i2.p1  ORF type:complete len:602 (+),score=74.57 c17471_g1_i2:484-2289(+)